MQRLIFGTKLSSSRIGSPVSTVPGSFRRGPPTGPALKTEGRERLFEDAEIDWLRDLNKGQMKVMANSLTVKFFEPDITSDEAKDPTVKERVFVREILLDPLTYDLFVQMTK